MIRGGVGGLWAVATRDRGGSTFYKMVGETGVGGLGRGRFEAECAVRPSRSALGARRRSGPIAPVGAQTQSEPFLHLRIPTVAERSR